MYFGLMFLGLAAYHTERDVVTEDSLRFIRHRITHHKQLQSKWYRTWLEKISYNESDLEALKRSGDAEDRNEWRRKHLEVAINHMCLLFSLENWSRRWSRALIALMYSLGFAMLAIPSIELFARVAASFFRLLLP